jgi:hypothetical protein
VTISVVSERFQDGTAHPLSRVLQAVRSTAALLSIKKTAARHRVKAPCPSSVLGCPMAGSRDATLHGILDNLRD